MRAVSDSASVNGVFPDAQWIFYSTRRIRSHGKRDLWREVAGKAAFAMLEERWADLDPGTQNGGKDLYEAAKASHRTLVDVFK